MQDFISFSLNYYRRRIRYYRSCPVTPENLREAGRLLKMVDDIVDEGYDGLYIALEKEGLYTDLREFLKENRVSPFPLPSCLAGKAEYTGETTELKAALDDLYRRAGTHRGRSDNPFIGEMKAFCRWVGYEEGTAYVFLLRDTLLPYLYYIREGRKNLYPLLIGRRFLELLGYPNLDDDIRCPIFNAGGRT